VARVQLARAAAEDLDRLIRTHNLPSDTKDRVKRALTRLERFPMLGPELSGRWEGFRFTLGPWRWMIVVYVYIPEDDRVVVVTIQDGRSAMFA
jgi:hypothetical protein